MTLNKKSLPQINEWLNEATEVGAIALIDKDKNWTSFDVVAKLRGIFQIRKVGHTGTLDPLATGLLVICFGKATKLSNNYTGLNKVYSAVIKLGAKTISDDAETEETDLLPLANINEDDILKVANSFLGNIEQKPPIYSAKWINGKRSYSLARKNVVFENKPQTVTINKIDVININLPFVSVMFDCSKGTYIRTLARDIGDSLGCGAYLYDLRRTRIGDFLIEDAIKINEIQNQLML